MKRCIMSRWVVASLFLPLSGNWLMGAEPVGRLTHEIRLNGNTFTLPIGFEIELAAGPPQVARPIVADFDDEGRLYVADSSGSNENVQKQLKKKPHRIVRLIDTRGDGRFDRAKVFAPGLMFPEGAMWHAGSLFVAAPPSIWKFTDTSGDGVADQRVEWFKGKTLTGCANDLHGPYRGPDGWIYWCKGAFAKQTYERSGQPPFTTRASHIFRCRPDGSGIEPVMNGGMDNPVEVVFTPGGERIFTTTFFQHPAGGHRDGLIHAIYGGVYGKDHEPIHEHPWTSPALMPVLTHLGPAAPAGLVRYESTVFGPEYKDNLFASLFNMRKVTRHVLHPDGATFKTVDEDFLVSNNLDFHPTDVVEDADGSLLVVDTGGWYKLCCPSSQLQKPDVLGAIYRVRRRGAATVADPRGRHLSLAKMTEEQLATHLDDVRPAVRQRVIQKLGEKGLSAVPSLTETIRHAHSADSRRNAVWAMTRIDHTDARAAVRAALADSDETVRQAALHSVSLWRDHAAFPQLLLLLRGPSLQNRRAAAETLGRLGNKAAVPPLFESIASLSSSSLEGNSQRVLEHSFTFAIIEIADPASASAALKSPNPFIRRAALTCLDQMRGSPVQAETVTEHLKSPISKLKETAWWIAGHHPEWAGVLAEFLRDRLIANAQTAANREELIGQLARFAAAPPVRALMVELLGRQTASVESRMIVLRAVAQTTVQDCPPEWLTGITKILAEEDGILVSEAVSTARTLHLKQGMPSNFASALLKIAGSDKTPASVRLNALAAVPEGLTVVEPAIFSFLLGYLSTEHPVSLRTVAAEVVARARLTTEQLRGLTKALDKTGPMELDRLLEAFAQSSDDGVGLYLLETIAKPSLRSALRAETLKPRLAKFGSAVQKKAAELYTVLDEDLIKQRTKLQHLLAGIKGGDVRRGQLVFNSTKAACASCHSIGYKGGNIGPDLTHIGKIRAESDLLESIVFPSASFVRSFEPILVTTHAGKTLNGLLRGETSDQIVLATNATEEVRIARSDIEDIQPGKVSVMPAGLDQQLTPAELADLIAFLKACN